MLTVRTDPASAGLKNTRALEHNFPQAGLLKTALFARLAQLGIDYNKQYARLTAGLTRGSLMQMFGDLTHVLSVPEPPGPGGSRGSRRSRAMAPRSTPPRAR